MGKSKSTFEIDTSVARWRRVWFSHYLTNDDFFECMDRFQSRYPEAIYFDAEAMRKIRDVWRNGRAITTLAEMTFGKDAPPIYRSIKDCIAAVPVQNWQTGSTLRERQQDMMARAPWPEEVSTGLLGIMAGSRAVPTYFSDERDRDTWRAYGRCMGIRWHPDYPDFVPAINRLWYLDGEHCGDCLSDLANCFIAYPYASLSHFRIAYCTNDPEMRAFVSGVRSLTRGLMTKGNVSLYECQTGRYLCAYPNKWKHEYSKRFLKTLALTPGAYQSFMRSDSILTYMDESALLPYRGGQPRMLGVGPSPRIRAQAFLEAGRSIDEIDGLDPVTRDAELRRHEKRLKAEKKAVDGAGKAH